MLLVAGQLQPGKESMTEYLGRRLRLDDKRSPTLIAKPLSARGTTLTSACFSFNRDVSVVHFGQLRASVSPRLQLASDQKHFLANIAYKPTLALLGKGWGSPCAFLLRMRSHQSEPEGARRPCCSLPDFSGGLLFFRSPPRKPERALQAPMCPFFARVHALSRAGIRRVPAPEVIL